MDPTTADFNAWLAEEGAKVGATVAPQGPPDNFLRGYGQGYQVDLGTDSVTPTTADILAKAQDGGAFPNWLRSMAPNVAPADDSSAWSGVTSRLARTGTGLVHSGMNTVANWLDKKPEIGPDTIAPLGLAPMGMALTPRNAVGAMGGKLPQGAPMVRDLEGMKPASSDAAKPTYRDHALAEGKDDLWGQSQISNLSEWMASPGARDREFGNRIAAGFDFLADKSPSKYLNADNARASLPGTVLNSVDQANASTRAATGLGHRTSVPGASEAARLARAREMGFDVDSPLYHGTDKAFDEFKVSERGKLGPGAYLTPDPNVAAKYGEAIMPLVARGRIATQAEREPFSQAAAAKTQDVKEWKALTQQMMQDAGFTGVRVQDEVVMFDPKNIRSKFAAFDPADSDKSGLLLSKSDNPAGTAINAPDDEDEKKRRKK